MKNNRDNTTLPISSVQHRVVDEFGVIGLDAIPYNVYFHFSKIHVIIDLLHHCFGH